MMENGDCRLHADGGVTVANVKAEECYGAVVFLDALGMKGVLGRGLDVLEIVARRRVVA